MMMMIKNLIKYLSFTIGLLNSINIAKSTNDINIVESPVVESVSVVEVEKSYADYSNLYSNFCIVTEIDINSDIVWVEDYGSRSYGFYGVEDWEIGDYCSIIIDGKGTENTNDDVVVSCRYHGIPNGSQSNCQ